MKRSKTEKSGSRILSRITEAKILRLESGKPCNDEKNRGVSQIWDGLHGFSKFGVKNSPGILLSRLTRGGFGA